MISIDEHTYYLGIWFLASKEGRDMMALAYRKQGEDFFRVSYRFRYYADPEERDGFNPFDDRDEKRFYEATCSPEQTEERVIEVVDGMLDELVKNGWCGTKLAWKVRELRHKNLCRGDGDAFQKLLFSLPYTHMRKPTPEEAANIAKDVFGKPVGEA